MSTENKEVKKVVEVKEVKLEIHTKELTNAEKGNKFLVYHTYIGKNEKRINVKFVTDCNNVPKDNGFIYVMTDKMNVDKSTKFPTLWVKDVVRFEKRAQNQQVFDIDNFQ